MKSNNVWVFVDVDGTLIDKDDAPRPFVAYFFMKLKRLDYGIVVWSAGGSEYAERKVGMISRRTGVNVNQFVDYFFAKSDYDKLEIDGTQFFIDDEIGLLEAMEKKGHGTFKVPFFEPNVEGAQDCWLLNAGQAVKVFILDLDKNE